MSINSARPRSPLTSAGPRATLFDPNYTPQPVYTIYNLGDESAFTKVQGGDGEPTKFVVYRNPTFLSKQSGPLVLSWIWPSRIPSHFTGVDRARIATEIAMFYGALGYAVPKCIEADLPTFPITLERDTWTTYGPLLTAADSNRYEQWTAGLDGAGSYRSRCAEEMEIYYKWPDATTAGKQSAHIKKRLQPPRYEYDQVIDQLQQQQEQQDQQQAPPAVATPPQYAFYDPRGWAPGSGGPGSNTRQRLDFPPAAGRGSGR